MEHFLLRRRHFHLWGWIKPRIWTSVITCKLVITETKNTCQGFASSRYHRRQRKCNGYAANQLEGGRWGHTFQCATHNNSVAETSPTLEEIGTSWNHPRCGRHRGKHTVTGLSYPKIPNTYGIGGDHQPQPLQKHHVITPEYPHRQMRNRLRWFSQGPILNRERRGTGLHWMTDSLDWRASKLRTGLFYRWVQVMSLPCWWTVQVWYRRCERYSDDKGHIAPLLRIH